MSPFRGNNSSARRLRVLILAESCNPEWSSVPLVGWSHYEALSRVADVHLVTRVRNRPALDRCGLKEGQDYTAINTEFLFEPIARLVRWISGPNKGWAVVTALTIPSYLLFELIARKRFKKRLREFDLVHRITPVSPAVPSPMATWCRRAGVPFVLGPLNGGLPWPKEFPNLRKQEGEWLSGFRSLFRALPGYRSTRNAAAAIIAGGKSAFREIPGIWKDKVVYIPENAFDPSRFPVPTHRRSAQDYQGRPLRAIYLGRLVPYKGCDMLLEAAADLLRQGRMTMTVVGSGPESKRIRNLIARLDIGHAVECTGELPHRQVAEYLRRADILTFPSVHEFGGAVVLEAMAMGVVPVISDYGGPAELASPHCAFLVPLQERDAYIQAFRDVLHTIASDPARLLPLAENGRQRADKLFTWPQKAEQILAVYRWVLGQETTRPDWGIPFKDD
ncbi:glycosyltransferase family 4 protein [Gluconacetobacter sacchari]|uniref:Glycosyltransferase family 4 protein n=1 Tax=Gluconacetobacter sacchari TaxID=92759 RepID=A0A7W4NQD8_9PROT|nr:glycosyltransferase family 4 protein [Gluconacetobacter sacchari]